jgi:hypothetical protein
LDSYLRLDGTDTQTALVRRGARGPRHRAAVECGYVKESAAGAKKNGAGEWRAGSAVATRSSFWIGVNNYFLSDVGYKQVFLFYLGFDMYSLR